MDHNRRKKWCLGNSKLQRVVKAAMIGFFGNDADIGERIHIALFFHVIETVDV